MKKSNAFMLSYIIFLLIALIADWFLGWQELNRIALAATLAGVLFAFADLINWYISYEKDFWDTILNTYNTIIESGNTAIVYSQSKIKQYNEIIELLNTQKDEHPVLTSIYDFAKEDLVFQKKQISVMETVNKNAEVLIHNRQKAEKKIKKYKNLETLLFIFGFVLFFITSVFDNIQMVLSNIESTLTVLSFGVIMLTYFLRECIENNYKKQLEEQISITKTSQENIKRMTQEVRDNNVIGTIKEFLENLETNKELKDLLKKAVEDTENG